MPMPSRLGLRNECRPRTPLRSSQQGLGVVSIPPPYSHGRHLDWVLIFWASGMAAWLLNGFGVNSGRASKWTIPSFFTFALYHSGLLFGFCPCE
jgi:hypothetical protein